MVFTPLNNAFAGPNECKEKDDIHFSVALSYIWLDTLREERPLAKGPDKLKINTSKGLRIL